MRSIEEYRLREGGALDQSESTDLNLQRQEVVDRVPITQVKLSRNATGGPPCEPNHRT